MWICSIRDTRAARNNHCSLKVVISGHQDGGRISFFLKSPNIGKPCQNLVKCGKVVYLAKKFVMEYHIHIVCDGQSVHIDGLPDGPDSLALPDYILQGIRMIWSLVKSRVKNADCICIGGIGYTGSTPALAAFDIWIQSGEEGCFLPMDLSARLFSQNGIPYYHSPFMS